MNYPYLKIRVSATVCVSPAEITGCTQAELGWDRGKQQEVPLANRQKICIVIMYTLRASNKHQEISKSQTANKSRRYST
jgi:hypothetical protein